MNKIRNFSIIAHINHGKSTISKRLIQQCYKTQKIDISKILNSMELEKEKGITIKFKNILLKYTAKDKKKYQLNLIDTPGHLDFHYEVYRALCACDGVLLIIDSSKGIEAQTISNTNIAKKMKLKIIPVINKIDIESSNLKKIKKDIQKILDINCKKIIYCSAKKGIGISKILEKIIKIIPKPKGNKHGSLRALIIDSYFNKYLGIILLVKIQNGNLKLQDKIKITNFNNIFNIEKIEIFTPKKKSCKILKCGYIGWITCRIKNTKITTVGQVITLYNDTNKKIINKFQKIKPLIYIEIFLKYKQQFNNLKKSLFKLHLNDSSFSYKKQHSSLFGLGFCCGFLGILHMEIICERLKREYCIDLIITTPIIKYKIYTADNKIIYLKNLSNIPKFNKIKKIKEPISICYILTPKKYIGNIINLCIKKRGIQKNIIYYYSKASLIYEIPTSEILFNFLNEIKNISHGYATLKYNFKKYKTTEIVIVDILINKIKIPNLSTITHKKNALKISTEYIKKLHNIVQKKQFNIHIQAAINNRIIKSTKIKQLKKNVTNKCYGGDISRKKKLIKKQNKGKKRMKKIGKINISKNILIKFFSIK